MKYYTEIKSQYNDLIYWELMSWYFIDMEESEGGKIVKEHNCPSLSSSCPLPLETFISHRHELHGRDRHQWTQMHRYWCVGVWGRLGRALPKNLASFPSASHFSRQQYRLCCLVFLSYSHTWMSRHFVGEGTVAVLIHLVRMTATSNWPPRSPSSLGRQRTIVTGGH